MGKHKHDEHCVPLKCAREYAQKITELKYPEKWIYHQERLKPHLRTGDDGKRCVSKVALAKYVEWEAKRRQKIDKSALIELLRRAKQSHDITQSEIEHEAGISHSGLWKLVNDKYKLSEKVYQQIADAIDRLIAGKGKS